MPFASHEQHGSVDGEQEPHCLPLVPMARLHTELLMEVMVQCCQESQVTFQIGRTTHPDEHLASLPAMALSAVCSRWRAIALNSPSLWSRFTVYLLRPEDLPLHDYKIYIQRTTMLVDTYLQRSKQRPLDLALYAKSPLPVVKPSIQCALVDRLVQQSERWRTLILANVQTPVPFDVPMLEQVDFARYDDSKFYMAEAGDLLDVSQRSSLPMGILKAAPKLRSIGVLSGYPAPRARELLLESSVCWANITSLTYSPLCGDLCKLLPLCVNLEELSVNMGNLVVNGASEGKFPFMELLSLRWLSVDRPDVLGTILGFSTFPTLHSLSVKTNEHSASSQWNSRPKDVLSSFLSNSGCESTLTQLELEGISLGDTEAIELLTPLRGLTQLSISDLEYHHEEEFIHRPVTPHLLAKLRVPSSTPVCTSSRAASRPSRLLLPNLEYLRLNALTNNAQDLLEQFVLTVQSRWHSLDDPNCVRCLRSVELRLLDQVQESDLKAIRERLHFERPTMSVVVKGMEDNIETQDMD